MRTFRLAMAGDFLDETGAVAYGDIDLGRLDADPCIHYNFLKDQAPRPGDASYWDRLYSLECTPRHVARIDGMIVLRAKITRATFADGAGDLVVIGRSGAGYDKIDLDACTANDVALFNAPLALNHATASAALLLMLALAKRLPELDRIVREGRWDRQASTMGSEIQGRTLGIIGLGYSGRELARLVAPFAMRILAYSPHADPDEAESLGVRLCGIEELLREADFVSLHCRLSPETRGILGRERLAMMKPSAFLINVGRGALVDQDALVDMLRDRRLAGAGLDVFREEPLPKDDPLTGLDNVILAPHWLASTSDVWHATGRAMTDGILRASRGLVPENVVNPEVLTQPGFRAKLDRFRENQAHL